MDEVVTQRDAVYARLDYLDRLVTDGDLASRAALADTEISRMTTAWRVLLVQHQPDENGRRRQCSRWRRPRQHPCSVWTTAHEHLITADYPPPTDLRDVAAVQATIQAARVSPPARPGPLPGR